MERHVCVYMHRLAFTHVHVCVYTFTFMWVSTYMHVSCTHMREERGFCFLEGNLKRRFRKRVLSLSVANFYSSLI
jgi:hypothetical protein